VCEVAAKEFYLIFEREEGELVADEDATERCRQATRDERLAESTVPVEGR
jgi:hypothetical protein